MLLPTMPLYVQSFDLSFGLISLVIAAKSIGTIIADIPVGYFLERLGRKRMMMTGLGVLAGAMMATALAESVVELFLYQMLAGVGMAVWSVSRHTYITDFIRIEARGRALAIFGGIGRFGSLTGPVVGGLIGQRFGLNVPIICEAAVAAIVFALIATCIKEPVGTTPQILEKIDHTRKIVTLVKNHARSLYTAGAAYICVQAIREGRRLITPLYGAVIIGLDVLSIGLIITIGSIVDLALFPIAGHIMDRYGRKYAMIPAFVIMAIGFVLMSFADSFEGLLLSQLVIGIGNGFGSGTMMTLGSDLAPTGERGQFLGIWRFIGDVGAVNGVLVVGVLADILSLAVVPIALSGLGVLASTIVFLFVKETLVPQQKPP